MIIAELSGGLGNQMFQYALGRNLAEKHGVQLKLDLTFINDRSSRPDFTFREYELNIFNTIQAFSSPEEVGSFFKPQKKLPRLFYKLNRIINPFDCIQEKIQSFDERVLQAGKNTYLRGYWQSEKYFEGIEEIIREEFSFKTIPDIETAKIMESIASVNAVSIHIRRGDFVSNKSINEHHGSCSPTYYKRGIMQILEKVKEPYFFIFSDDLIWVKENFKIDFPHMFVEKSNSKNNFEDMRMMSKCNHHIIANSSFSWWGAWLNKNSEKIIIAPAQWFNNEGLRGVSPVPEGWIRI